MKYKIYLCMEVTTKTELKELFKSNILSGNGSRKVYWLNHLVVFYHELQTWNFPEYFTFPQKIYHYLNDDPELKLGICPECGKRCCFRGVNKGYPHFCSHYCAYKSDLVKNKREQTCLEHFGTKHPMQFEEVKEKSRQTCLEHFNCEYSFQSEEVKEKSRQTCLEKYDKEYYFQTDEFRNKLKEYSLKTYGCENPAQSEEVKEKMKQTNIERRGCEYPAQSEEVKEKFKQKIQSITEKVYQTKKRNNSFNTSKIEEQLKQYLTKNNINYIYQYKSEQYPFSCDFYFPDKDLYIEIQGSWTHGPHPFSEAEEDKLLLEKWKSKNTKYYNNAIETWTVRDVKKRETAKINKLNYLEIFSNELDFCIIEILKYI